MMWQRVVCGVAFAIALTSGWACGSSNDQATTNPCPPDNPECKELATIEAGQQAVVKRKCVDCHGQDMSGSTTALAGYDRTIPGCQLGVDPLCEAVELYPPNLTSDPTGIAPPEKGGKWTDDAIVYAIRSGYDNDSQQLCPQMKRHGADMSDFEVYSIVKYLRSIAPVAKAIPRSVCPPTKTKDQQNLPHS